VQACRTFPAYKLNDLDGEERLDVMKALELLGLARETEEARRG
jgi:hypothetical protein